MPSQLFGSTTGLKPAQIARIEHLYRRRVDPKLIVTPLLAANLAEISAEIGRQLGILLDRKGNIEQVILGQARSLLLPDLGRHRAGTGRFRGLRLLHTHLDGEALSPEDLTDLARLRLDLITALQVEAGGQAGKLLSAHLLPENPQGEVWKLLPPESVHEPRRDLDAFLQELEAEFARKADLLRGAEEGETAVAIHVAIPGQAVDPEDSLVELAELARTAGVTILERVVQRRAAFDANTLMGKGKLDEIIQRAAQLDAELLLVDHDLSPRQIRAISEATDLKVIDRTTLILDIFAQHAATREGKLQVELAQLRYDLPRMAGRYGAIMRQSGGVGGRRGPGEKKLELDRRAIKDRIRLLERQLEEVSRHRSNRRSLRQRRQVPIVALVGYTNAGKSTLLNTLTQSEVLAEDKLFATLDPTSRRLRFPEEREVIFSDTVGFLRDLPRDLIRAFKATLEELSEADLLLHVLDAADPARVQQLDAVQRILQDLGLDRIPRLVVLNKVDRLPADERNFGDLDVGDAVPVSALDAESTRPLLERIAEELWAKDRLADPGALTQGRWAAQPVAED